MTKSYKMLTSLCRAVGHTTAAMGMYAGERIVVVATERQRHSLHKQHCNSDSSLRFCSLAQANGGGLLGRRTPVVFDHYAVATIIEDYERSIADLGTQHQADLDAEEGRSSVLESELEEAYEDNRKLQDRLEELRSQIPENPQ